jgi:hypothetical protein
MRSLVEPDSNDGLADQVGETTKNREDRNECPATVIDGFESTKLSEDDIEDDSKEFGWDEPNHQFFDRSHWDSLVEA